MYGVRESAAHLCLPVHTGSRLTHTWRLDLEPTECAFAFGQIELSLEMSRELSRPKGETESSAFVTISSGVGCV